VAFDYAKSAATAKRLIANFGRPVIIRTPGAATGPAYNPTPGTPSDETVSAVELKDSIMNRSRQLTKFGDRMMLIEAPDGGAPSLDATIIEAGEPWRIVESIPFSPGPSLVYAELLLRR